MAEGSTSGTVDLGATTPWVRRWLRAEGIAALVGGFLAWLGLEAPWPLFFLFLLVPDLSMIGYRQGPHAGAITYNIVHNWATSGLVLGLGIAAASPALTLAGLILIAHVGMDRAFGYGLKYPTSFQDTHLGRIGRRRT
ncbi:MAG: DUF4260 domain-containing protein [Chloroflexi bacterium]|nr:DUF4260 domain-containing protein [Chloroflexota bacterium]